MPREREPHIIPEKKTVGTDASKAFACPLAIPVCQNAFNGISEYSFVGKFNVEKQIHVSVGIICGVSDQQVQFMQVNGVIDGNIKVDDVVDMPF